MHSNCLDDPTGAEILCGKASAEHVLLESAPAALERWNLLNRVGMLKKCCWKVLQQHLSVRNGGIRPEC